MGRGCFNHFWITFDVLLLLHSGMRGTASRIWEFSSVDVSMCSMKTRHRIRCVRWVSAWHCSVICLARTSCARRACSLQHRPLPWYYHVGFAGAPSSEGNDYLENQCSSKNCVRRLWGFEKPGAYNDWCERQPHRVSPWSILLVATDLQVCVILGLRDPLKFTLALHELAANCIHFCLPRLITFVFLIFNTTSPHPLPFPAWLKPSLKPFKRINLPSTRLSASLMDFLWVTQSYCLSCSAFTNSKCDLLINCLVQLNICFHLSDLFGSPPA